MSYTVLSRKWRPKTFEDVVGQTHITKILENSISQNKVSHAYLFSGPRGVGKTTIARIMSCYLNKVDSIISSIDIIELDGASNRGIDEIRDIKESVRYAPSEGKYKIFIIDESHMLTKEAFNALLKTLEEPPSKVVFILATTEFNKLPLTIVSRCQRYAFKRISINNIVDYLKLILNKEGYSFDDKALRLIAYKADGSMRDALSLLDKVITLCENNLISDNIVKNALGVIDEQEYLNILKSIVNESFEGTFSSVEKILNGGISIHNFMEGFNVYLKDIVYYFSNYKKNISLSPDSISFLEKSQINIQTASKLLNVNLDFLIKYNYNISTISLENHFIKIFSYVNRQNSVVRNNERVDVNLKNNTNSISKTDSELQAKNVLPKDNTEVTQSDNTNSISKTDAELQAKNVLPKDNTEVTQSDNTDSISKTDAELQAENVLSKDNTEVNQSNNTDPTSKEKVDDYNTQTNLINNSDVDRIYSELVQYFEKNDYKLYCVLVKCDVRSYSGNIIEVSGTELSTYEKNSITRETEQINKVLKRLSDTSNELSLKIKFTYSDSEIKDNNQDLKIEKTEMFKKDDKKKEYKNDDEDHPLFDSIVDDLEGKLLK